MAASTPSAPRHAVGSLALGLICAGGLLAGVAAVPRAHAGASMHSVYRQHSSMNHGNTRSVQGVICHDCGRFGPYVHVYPESSADPWSARPRIVPDPNANPWRISILGAFHGAAHGTVQLAINPQPLPPHGGDE